MSKQIKWYPLGEKPEVPHRRPQDVGTLGRHIKLQANFFPVEMKNPSKTLFHFDVDFKETISGSLVSVQLPKKKRLHIFEKMKRTYPKVFEKALIGYDCEKNAYSVESFCNALERKNGEQFKVNFSDDGSKPREYIVCMKVVSKDDLSVLFDALRAPHREREMPFNVLQMLEILFHQNPTVRFEKIGRNSFFSLKGEFGPSQDIGGGKEAMVGFFESLRPVAWKKDTILLNVDVAHAAFYKEQSLLDFMKNDLGFREDDFYRPLPPYKHARLKKELKNLKIQVTHTLIPRTYKVQDVSPLGADRQMFPLDKGDGNVSDCSVQHYFHSQYQRELIFPKLNCIKVGPVKRNIFLPIEVCRIAKGQKVIKKLNDRETAQFIRGTAKQPYERFNTIKNMVRTQNYSKDPILKALEFSVSDQPVSLDGRILPAPKLLMDVEFLPDRGVWDPRDRTFYDASTLETWVVMNYDGQYVREDVLWNFVGMLTRMGQERGMVIKDPQMVRNFRYPNPEVDLHNVKQKYPNVQIILIVLPKMGDYYARVKKVGDREVMIVTQCVQGSNVQKCAPPTVSNIILKINAKLGGTNNILGIDSRPIVFTTPVMIMGADVNHPPSHDKTTPSLAAVLASTDRYGCRYASEVRHQEHRTEMIQDLKNMTKNLLMTFYKSTNRKPQRIVMYRDGVSESQFLEVLSFELRAMRAACTELHKDYQPGITFLVVQKRHHTRLFCSERDGVGRSKNIPPGTTVDSKITHPTERDFYLCSHQGIQGTSRPTHYHVLWDDNDLTMDQLQTMTYAMCHLYSRCTRSVSIPTPAYYAHLLAFRAKVHIRDLCQSETSSHSSGETEGNVVSDVTMMRAAKIDRLQEISSKLYFV